VIEGETMGDAEYTPQHPDAYAGRPAFMAAPWRRSPFVVDEPGVFAGGDGDEGEPRLVHWESISEVVLYETTVRGSSGVRTVDAVGLRLHGRPDVISVQRVLTSWTLDRADLEAAVARFAPGIAVVDGPSQTNRARILQDFERLADVVADAADDESDDVARRPGEPLYGPRTTPAEPAHSSAGAGTAEPVPAYGTPGAAPRPEPEPVPAYGSPEAGAADPAAYVVKADARTAVTPAMFAVIGTAVAGFALFLGLGVFALFGAAFWIPLLMHLRDVRRGVVYFSVDADGVFLGRAADDNRSPSLEIRAPWESIAAVTVFEVEDVDTDSQGRTTTDWHKAVGLTMRAGRSGSRGGVAHYQVFDSFGLDRQALEAAVARFGGGTPVVDGPALGSASLGDVAGAVLDFLRNRGQS
jgi:hypothetical protein